MTDTQKKISLEEYFKKGKVLIVDDMADMRRTTKNLLREMGVEGDNIFEAGDGKQALEIIRNDPQRILFILLDWNMPVLTGIQTLEIIKGDEKLRHIFVLMITAENDMNQISQATEFNTDGYIIKPFLFETLQEKMLNIINPPAYLKLIKEGEELFDSGEFDKALTIFQQILLSKPESASVRILMGQVYEGLKNHEKAHSLYKEAIEKNPQYLRAYKTLADFHIKIGDRESALKILEKAARLNPKNASRQFMIGKLALETEKDMEKAGLAFKTATKESPELAKEIAEIYLENGKAERAEEFFRIALHQKENIHLYNRLGIALKKQEKWEKAVVEYQKALKIEPKNAIIFYNIGMVYLEWNKIAGEKKENAVKFLKQALEINPNFKEAKQTLIHLAS